MFLSQEFAVSHWASPTDDALEILVRRYARIMPIVFVNVFQVAMPYLGPEWRVRCTQREGGGGGGGYPLTVTSKCFQLTA